MTALIIVNENLHIQSHKYATLVLCIFLTPVLGRQPATSQRKLTLKIKKHRCELSKNEYVNNYYNNNYSTLLSNTTHCKHLKDVVL